MSGIYIPDVGLPQDRDFELWIAVKKDRTFSYNVSGDWHNSDRVAIPVPTHGDLIDRDELVKKCEWANVDDDTDVRAIRYDVVCNAPTIIPAEEGE